MIDPRTPRLFPLARLVRAALLAGCAAVLVASCGAKVTVDEASGGEGGAGGAGGGVLSSVSSTGSGGLMCGQEPKEGKIVAVCVSNMQGDFCPPAATTPGLLQTLAEAMKVCAQTSPGSCCGQAALVQVVCDLLPGNNECCYHAHYFEAAPCN